MMAPIDFSPIVYAVFGAIAGSFGNMLVWRIPNKCMLTDSRSSCPECKHQISWYENIPVFSYIFLLGKCRHCKNRIPLRYLILEIAMSALWGSLAMVVWDTSYLLMLLFFSFLLLVLSAIDIETGLLPNVLTLPGIVAGVAFNVLHGNAVAGLIGAGAGYLSFWLIAEGFRRFRGVEGMGHGDFKLMAMIGAFLGWQALPTIALIASLSGIASAGIYVVFSSKLKMNTRIPFGPYLAAGGITYAVLFTFGLGIIQ